MKFKQMKKISQYKRVYLFKDWKHKILRDIQMKIQKEKKVMKIFFIENIQTKK